MAFGLQEAFGDNVLTLSAQGTGTVTSGSIGVSGQAAYVLLGVHVTAVGGTPTLNASLEESSDGTTWTAVTGSGITQLAATGNAVAFARTTKNFVRVTTTVGGTTPSVTATANVIVFAE